jgi:hypothetical protein
MLRLAASLADQVSVTLGDAITGIDDRDVGALLVKAVLHASERRQVPRSQQTSERTFVLVELGLSSLSRCLRAVQP